MENNIDHLCPSEPFSGTLPCDLHLTSTANGSIPEELPTTKDLGDSSYESAEDIPNGSMVTKTDTPSHDQVGKTPQKVVKVTFVSEILSILSRLWKMLIFIYFVMVAVALLIVIVVSVVFVKVAVALYDYVDNDIFSSVWQYFTPENDSVPFIATQNISNSST